jgi:hypothetical protein
MIKNINHETEFADVLCFGSRNSSKRSNEVFGASESSDTNSKRDPRSTKVDRKFESAESFDFSIAVGRNFGLPTYDTHATSSVS